MKKCLILLTALVLAFGLVACNKQPPAKPQASTKPATPVAPKPDTTAKLQPAPAANMRDITQAPPLMKFKGTPYLTIKVKDMGTIRMKLNAKAAPKNVSNVYQLARAGFYDGLIFHRIVPGFVIQGGDPTGTGAGGPSYTVPGEFTLKHKRGSAAMARTGDNVNPTRASSSCQFYVCLQDLPQLDAGGYTVIGEVVSGMSVVDAIAKVERDARDKPLKPVVMESVTAEEVE